MIYSNKELKLYAANAIAETDLSNKDKLELLSCLKESDLLRTLNFLNQGKFNLSKDLEINKIAKENLLNKQLNEDINDYMFGKFCFQKLNEVSIKYNPDRFFYLFHPWKKSPSKTFVGGGNSLKFSVDKNLINNKTSLNLDATASKSTKIIAGTVIGLLIIAFSKYVFNKYISKSFKICGKLKGKEYSACVAKFKINGYKEAIKKMEGLKTKKCPETKHPEKCKDKVDEGIAKYKKKIKDWEINIKDLKNED